MREEMKKTICKMACHVDYKQAVWPESWGRGLRGAREEGRRRLAGENDQRRS